MLGVMAQTVRRWAQAGKIPSVQVDNQYQFELEPVLLALRSIELDQSPPRMVCRMPRCPACKSQDQFTNATRRRPVNGRPAIIRYHLCRDCGDGFQSVEFEDED